MKTISLKVKYNDKEESINFVNIHKSYFPGETICLKIEASNYYSSITDDLTDTDMTMLRIKVANKVYGFCKSPKFGDKHIFVLTDGKHSPAAFYSELGINCKDFTEIPDILISDGLTNASAMFYGLPSLVTAPYIDTRKVTDFSSMFRPCQSLVSIPWEIDMQNCPDDKNNYYNMFHLCDKLTDVKLKNVPKHFDPETASLKDGQYTILSWQN